jgi:hypothetical protein
MLQQPACASMSDCAEHHALQGKDGALTEVTQEQTDGLQEKDEFVDNIKEDIKAMGLQHEPITYTSDYFDDLRVRLFPRHHHAAHLRLLSAVNVLRADSCTALTYMPTLI